MSSLFLTERDYRMFTLKNQYRKLPTLFTTFFRLQI